MGAAVVVVVAAVVVAVVVVVAAAWGPGNTVAELAGLGKQGRIASSYTDRYIQALLRIGQDRMVYSVHSSGDQVQVHWDPPAPHPSLCLCPSPICRKLYL